MTTYDEIKDLEPTPDELASIVVPDLTGWSDIDDVDLYIW